MKKIPFTEINLNDVGQFGSRVATVSRCTRRCRGRRHTAFRWFGRGIRASARKICFGGGLALLLAFGTPRRGVAGAFAKLDRANVQLRIAAAQSRAVSGSAIWLVARVRNVGKGRLMIPMGLGPLQYFRVTVLRVGSRVPVPWLRAGFAGREMNIHMLVAKSLPPGKSVQFWEDTPINRYFDMSMPGRYSVRFAVGRVKSNWLGLTIKPPQFRKLKGEVLQSRLAFAPQQKGQTRSGLQVYLTQLASAGKTGPTGVRIYLRDGGRKTRMVGLTGDRRLDIKAIEVDGPDGYNGDELVKKPKPHYIPIPNHQQAPLTAYGRWLLKHPPKKLPEKSCTLKPGEVYKYAVPINLSCQFDMSLSGVYHVRIELAHQRVWSNWLEVDVPAIENPGSH